jgi:hypothetical protein
MRRVVALAQLASPSLYPATLAVVEEALEVVEVQVVLEVGQVVVVEAVVAQEALVVQVGEEVVHHHQRQQRPPAPTGWVALATGRQ